MIAIASPIARPTPKTTAVATPLLAAGRLTLKIVSILVAPSARDASSYSFGTALSAFSDTLMMEGRIIIASTMIAASSDAPEERSNISRIAGTSTIIPTKPYTTDGIPASSSTAVWMIPATFGDAHLERKIAVIKPIGTPTTTAPAVP